FDTVVEYSGNFHVEEFRIGQTNAEPSYLRMRVETDDAGDMSKLVGQLLGLGCTPVDSGDAVLAPVPRDFCPPQDFYPTPNQRAKIGQKGGWVDGEKQRMDAMVVVAEGRPACRRLRDLKQGDQVVVGMRGIRVLPESKERNRLGFAFMANDI